MYHKVRCPKKADRLNHSLTCEDFSFYWYTFVFQTSVWVNPSEALYPTILEDYLYYFLPLDGKGVPAMPNLAPPVRSPLQTHMQR